MLSYFKFSSTSNRTLNANFAIEDSKPRSSFLTRQISSKISNQKPRETTVMERLRQNCKCYIPAITKEVKSGDNIGRKYFGCAEGRCDLFIWVDRHLPPTIHPMNISTNTTGTKNYQGYNLTNSYNKNNSTSSDHTFNQSLKKIQFTLTGFDYSNLHEVSVWFGILDSSQSSEITKLILEFPMSMRDYKVSLRMWKCNMKIYTDLLIKLQSLPYNQIVQVEPFPSFLVTAIMTYVTKINKLKLKNTQNEKCITSSSCSISGSSNDSNANDNANANNVMVIHEQSALIDITSTNINNVTSITTSSHPLSISFNIESSLLQELLPFQLDGIAFVITRGGRGMIADEMGCGKTIQAIGLIQHYRTHWPVLILAPVGLLLQWKKEILQFSSSLISDTEILIMSSDMTTAKKTSKQTIKIYLVPYTMIEKVAYSKKIRPEQFGMVIADESHHLKNRETKKSNAAIPFLKQATIAICLTGTPATNRPVELYAQLHGLLPDIFNNYDGFIRRYCGAKPDKYIQGKMDVRGCTNPNELKILLENMVMIRRLKQDVLNALPKKSREVKYVDIEAKYRKEIDKYIQQTAQKEKLLLEATTLQSNGYSSGINTETGNNDTLNKLRNELQYLRNAQYQAVGNSKVEYVKRFLYDFIYEHRMKCPITTTTTTATSVCPPSSSSIKNPDEVGDNIDCEEDEEKELETFKHKKKVKKLNKKENKKLTKVLISKAHTQIKDDIINIEEEEEDDEKDIEAVLQYSHLRSRGKMHPDVTLNKSIAATVSDTSSCMKIESSTIDIVEINEDSDMDINETHKSKSKSKGKSRVAKLNKSSPTIEDSLGDILFQDTDLFAIEEDASEITSSFKRIRKRLVADKKSPSLYKNDRKNGDINNLKSDKKKVMAHDSIDSTVDDDDDEIWTDSERVEDKSKSREKPIANDTREKREILSTVSIFKNLKRRCHRSNQRILSSDSDAESESGSDIDHVITTNQLNMQITKSLRTAETIECVSFNIDKNEEIDDAYDDSDSVIMTRKNRVLKKNSLHSIVIRSKSDTSINDYKSEGNLSVEKEDDSDGSPDSDSESCIILDSDSDSHDDSDNTNDDEIESNYSEDDDDDDEMEEYSNNDMKKKKKKSKRTKRPRSNQSSGNNKSKKNKIIHIQTDQCDIEGKVTQIEKKIPLGIKIILFAHHSAVLDALESYIKQEKLGYVRIDGSTTRKQKDALVTQFQTDNETDIALLSLTACGTGLNLTRANIAIFAELHDSLGNILQAEDRIHRIGQKSSVVRIIYIIARDTVDMKIWQQMQNKHNVLQATVGIADNNSAYGGGMHVTTCNGQQTKGIESFMTTMNSPGNTGVTHNPTLSTIATRGMSDNTKLSSIQDIIATTSLYADPSLAQSKNVKQTQLSTYYPLVPSETTTSASSTSSSSSVKSGYSDTILGDGCHTNTYNANSMASARVIKDDPCHSYSTHNTLLQPTSMPPSGQQNPMIPCPASINSTTAAAVAVAVDPIGILKDSQSQRSFMYDIPSQSQLPLIHSPAGLHTGVPLPPLSPTRHNRTMTANTASTSSITLSPQQRAKIESNRQMAMMKYQANHDGSSSIRTSSRPLCQLHVSPTRQKVINGSNNNSTISMMNTEQPSYVSASMHSDGSRSLSPSTRARIEANRQRALDLLKSKKQQQQQQELQHSISTNKGIHTAYTGLSHTVSDNSSNYYEGNINGGRSAELSHQCTYKSADATTANMMLPHTVSPPSSDENIHPDLVSHNTYLNNDTLKKCVDRPGCSSTAVMYSFQTGKGHTVQVQVQETNGPWNPYK